MNLTSRIRATRLYCRSLSISTQRYEAKKGDKVIVGMSGGVDSSVAALLLAKDDCYDLSAVYMRNWDTRDEFGTDRGCEWEKDWEDVQLVCRKLGIPCELIDLSKEYWNRVFEPALRQWEHGITPNPDVWCNKEIKFGELLRRLPLKESENRWFATGHYAAKSWENLSTSTSTSSPSSSPSTTKTEPRRPKLIRPIDRKKDQTYFLSSISEVALRKTLFPLSHLTKPEVRTLARQYGFVNAERKDSVGICFVGQKERFQRFLADYIPRKPGSIVHELTGKVIGEHNGLWEFTIGQNLRWPGLPCKLYVCKKDIETNTIYVVPGNAHESLMSRFIHVMDFTWIWKDGPFPSGIDTSKGARLSFVPRYRTDPAICTVRRCQNGHLLIIECDEPQHAITPGQVAVLYDGDWCLGSGVISTAS